MHRDSLHEAEDELFFDGKVNGRWGAMAVLACQRKRWRITSSIVEIDKGCCGGDNSVSFDLKHVKDMAFSHSCWQVLYGRGRITFFVAEPGNSAERQYHLTVPNAERLYHIVRKAWTDAKLSFVPQGSQ